MKHLIGAGLAAAALAAIPAHAQLVEEFRLGAFSHDVDLLGDGSGGIESGVNVEGQLVFATPGALDWAWDPEPFAVFSWNSDGDTNFGGVGLRWNRNFTDRLVGEIGFGYVLHDGVVELPPVPSDPDRLRLDATRVIFGSRDLFYTEISAGVRLTDRVDASFVFEHLSHGQILGHGRNQGLDNLGVRVGYHFGE